jgi:hypothetical protein
MFYDDSYGLGRVELGVPALVAAVECFNECRVAFDPFREVVGGHVRVAVGEIHIGQFALGVTLDNHFFLFVLMDLCLYLTVYL